MALTAWWPLNGDTKDYSGNGYDLINNGATVNAEGKIGQCYNFAGYTEWLAKKNFPKNGVNFSWCAWVKLSMIGSGTGNSRIFIISQGRDNSLSGINIVVNLQGRLGYYLKGKEVFSSDICEIDKWYHVSLTSDGKEFKFFVDGILKLNESYAPVDFTFATDDALVLGKMGYLYTQTGQYFPFFGYLNDVRIYDHALTEDEVKEIAKAKILHWTFNENAEPTENLLINPSCDSVSKGYTGLTLMPIVLNNEKVIQLQTNSSIDNAASRFAISSLKSSVNKTNCYSLSVWARADSSNTGLQRKLKCYTGGKWIEMFDENGKTEMAEHWKLFKAENTQLGSTSSNTAFEISTTHAQGISNLNHSDKFYFKKPMVEEKPYATEYVDGVREGKVIDNSGFGNHGVIDMATSPRWTDKSRFGSGCYYFAEGNKNTIIKTNSNFLLPKDSFTISYWLNETMLYNGSYDRFHIGQTSNSASTTLGWKFLTGYGNDSGYFRAANSSGNVINTGTSYTSPKDTWVNMALRYNSLDNTISMFKDGINIRTFNATNFNTTLNHYPLSIGNAISLSNRMNGYFDDARIYATALSDEDIKDMYRAKITKDGVFKTQGIVEAQNWRKLGNNLLDYSVWRSQYLTKPNGALPNLTIWGNSTENTRTYSENPWGELDIVWKGTNERNYIYQNNGFHCTMTADTTKKYRLSLWVKRKNGPSSSSKGSIYFGTTNSSSNPVINIGDGSEGTNPYWITDVSTNEEWVLLVGYIQAHTDTTTTASSESGSYKIAGKLSSHGREFRFKEGYPRLIFRTFLYNCQEPDTQVLYYRPRIDCCDGTEPSIQDLLAGYEDGREIRPQITDRNELSVGEISEMDVLSSITNKCEILGKDNLFDDSDSICNWINDTEVIISKIKGYGPGIVFKSNSFNLRKNQIYKLSYEVECLEGEIETIGGCIGPYVFQNTLFKINGIDTKTTTNNSYKIPKNKRFKKHFVEAEYKALINGKFGINQLGIQINRMSNVNVVVKITKLSFSEKESFESHKQNYKPMTRDGVLHMKEFNEID